MFIKVCGLKSIKEIDWAIELGYNAIGVVLYRQSKRFIDPKKAIDFAYYCKNKITSIAVGITYEDVKEVEKFFDYIQISENIEKENVIFSIEEYIEDKTNRYIIFDRSKGKGLYSFYYPEWLLKYKNRLIIAGGLTPENVGEIMDKIRPFGIDVSSGVEINGVKSYHKMRDFIKEVKKWI